MRRKSQKAYKKPEGHQTSAVHGKSKSWMAQNVSWPSRVYSGGTCIGVCRRPGDPGTTRYPRNPSLLVSAAHLSKRFRYYPLIDLGDIRQLFQPIAHAVTRTTSKTRYRQTSTLYLNFKIQLSPFFRPRLFSSFSFPFLLSDSFPRPEIWGV